MFWRGTLPDAPHLQRPGNLVRLTTSPVDRTVRCHTTGQAFSGRRKSHYFVLCSEPIALSVRPLLFIPPYPTKHSLSIKTPSFCAGYPTELRRSNLFSKKPQTRDKEKSFPNLQTTHCLLTEHLIQMGVSTSSWWRLALPSSIRAPAHPHPLP